MDETGIGLLVLLGQPHPDLQATEPLISLPAFGRRALRVHDAPARRHPVHLARQDGLRMPRAIAMHHRPFVQICDRGQPDMRMRPHIDAAASPEFDRPHMIQEHERPDGALLRRRQRPPNLESAQIAAARHHHRFNLARAVIRQGRHGHFSQLNPATAFHLSNTRHPSIVARPPHRGRTDPAPPVRSGALKRAALGGPLLQVKHQHFGVLAVRQLHGDLIAERQRVAGLQRLAIGDDLAPGHVHPGTTPAASGSSALSSPSNKPAYSRAS